MFQRAPVLSRLSRTNPSSPSIQPLFSAAHLDPARAVSDAKQVGRVSASKTRHRRASDRASSCPQLPADPPAVSYSGTERDNIITRRAKANSLVVSGSPNTPFMLLPGRYRQPSIVRRHVRLALPSGRHHSRSLSRSKHELFVRQVLGCELVCPSCSVGVHLQRQGGLLPASLFGTDAENLCMSGVHHHQRRAAGTGSLHIDVTSRTEATDPSLSLFSLCEMPWLAFVGRGRAVVILLRLPCRTRLCQGGACKPNQLCTNLHFCHQPLSRLHTNPEMA
jgi:hypothetical protein